MSRPTFGPEQKTLGHPATTRWLAQMDADEARSIARTNDAILTANVERVLRAMDRLATAYVIQDRRSRLYYVRPGQGRIGIVWGSLDLAERFEFMTIAWGTVLFTIEEVVDLFDVLAVQS